MGGISITRNQYKRIYNEVIDKTIRVMDLDDLELIHDLVFDFVGFCDALSNCETLKLIAIIVISLLYP